VIGRIAGTLIEKNPPQITVDVGGVGYELEVPMSTFYNLPALGERVSLVTHLVVREDAHCLYGFGADDERTAFRQLIRISGIGARTALALLSGLSVGELAQAVVLQEPGRLVKVPGIGKKTAERLLLELKGKLKTTGLAAKVSHGDTPPDAASDILNALLALGYNEREALGAMKALPDGVAVSDGIRQALKALSKG
jgi:holliday junction DNA helicase RuvA